MPMTENGGWPGMASSVAFAVAAVSLVLYFALVPPYGYIGAAVASSIAYATGFVINALIFRRFTGIGVIRVLVPTAEEARRIAGVLGAVRRRLVGPRE